jgi:mono/diheme cytochrome c family protein
MSKRPFVIFGIFAVICLVALPFWALATEGSEDASPEGSVSASDRQGLELFQINCGACHTLAAAGTDGIVGPNLDELLGTAPKSADAVKNNSDRVYNAVTQGVPPGGGRMPQGILQGAQAKAVARFVADNVQYIPGS